MTRTSGRAVAFGALMAACGPALAQDPCATVTSQGTSLPGFAGAKAETRKSGNNLICDMWTRDRKPKLVLTVEPPEAASGLPMRKMLAANAREPGMKVKDEPALRANAFSFATGVQLSFTGAGHGGVYSLTLDRDAGLAPGDEDLVRAIAKQVIAGR